MENDKKKATPDIDEEMMMDLMVDGVRIDGLQPPPEELTAPAKHRDNQAEKPLPEQAAVKDKPTAKKPSDETYESIFFKKTSANAREGKTVYVRPDFHEKLSRIVQVIGENKMSIYAYLDNLLEHHFKEFGEEITTSFNRKYKPIL